MYLHRRHKCEQTTETNESFVTRTNVPLVGALTAIGDVNRSIAIGSTPMERTSRYVTLP